MRAKRFVEAVVKMWYTAAFITLLFALIWGVTKLVDGVYKLFY